MLRPTARATAIPIATLSHGGKLVCAPVTNPNPVSDIAHNKTPTMLKIVNFVGGTPARPAVPAPTVRPNGMNRAATMAAPPTARNRECTRSIDRVIRRPIPLRASTPENPWRPIR